MAVPTLEEFLERFPEQGSHPIPVIEDCLLVASGNCSADVWGEIHGSGVGFYAAHLLDLRTREIGAMVGQPVNGITGQGLQATFYGQQFETLRQGLPITGLAF